MEKMSAREEKCACVRSSKETKTTSDNKRRHGSVYLSYDRASFHNKRDFELAMLYLVSLEPFCFPKNINIIENEISGINFYSILTHFVTCMTS